MVLIDFLHNRQPTLTHSSPVFLYASLIGGSHAVNMYQINSSHIWVKETRGLPR